MAIIGWAKFHPPPSVGLSHLFQSHQLSHYSLVSSKHWEGGEVPFCHLIPALFTHLCFLVWTQRKFVLSSRSSEWALSLYTVFSPTKFPFPQPSGDQWPILPSFHQDLFKVYCCWMKDLWWSLNRQRFCHHRPWSSREEREKNNKSTNEQLQVR